ncbi:MAG: sulfatase [Planctomycetota bacterium]|jgi:arylsulfatase A-like enzyme
MAHTSLKGAPRSISHSFTLAAAALCALAAACVSSGSEEAGHVGLAVQEAAPRLEPPKHFVVFIVDDLGWQDVSVPLGPEETPFNRRYRTPNVARLAAEGLSLTNGYAACPVCTPTRVSLLTGESPARHGATYWIRNQDQDTSARRDDIRAPEWDLNGLQPGDATLAHDLRAAGFHTIHVGKAHWGSRKSPGSDPTQLGFDVNIAGHGLGAPGSYYGRHNFSGAVRNNNQNTEWDVPGLEAYHGQDVFLTDVLAEEADRALRAALDADERVFLHFAPYGVHTPIMANERLLEPYADLHPTEAAYSTMIESYDAALGRILDTLDEYGIADDTLVIFTSDNGGLSAHARGGQANTHNAPLKSGKGSAYEGGVRVPWFVRFPGRVPAGSRDATPVITHDIYPTLMALGGAEFDPERTLDGQSLEVLWRRTKDYLPPRPLVWHMPHQWGAKAPGVQPFSSLRHGQHKLIYWHASQTCELYDLDADLSEERDLAAEEPELLRKLAYLLEQELEARGASPSVFIEDGSPVPGPFTALFGSEG